MREGEEENGFLESLATAMFLQLLKERELMRVCCLHSNGSFPLAWSPCWPGLGEDRA